MFEENNLDMFMFLQYLYLVNYIFEIHSLSMDFIIFDSIFVSVLFWKNKSDNIEIDYKGLLL